MALPSQKWYEGFPTNLDVCRLVGSTCPTRRCAAIRGPCWTSSFAPTTTTLLRAALRTAASWWVLWWWSTSARDNRSHPLFSWIDLGDPGLRADFSINRAGGEAGGSLQARGHPQLAPHRPQRTHECRWAQARIYWTSPTLDQELKSFKSTTQASTWCLLLNRWKWNLDYRLYFTVMIHYNDQELTGTQLPVADVDDKEKLAQDGTLGETTTNGARMWFDVSEKKFHLLLNLTLSHKYDSIPYYYCYYYCYYY